MAGCELLNNCIFFNDKMADMPSTSNVFKMMYCNDNYSACARFHVRNKVGREQVPADLFPNQHERAECIIKDKAAI